MEILISSLTAKSYKKTLKKIIDILNRQEHERRKGNFDLWLEGKIKIYKEISKAEFSIEEKIKKQEWLSLLYDRRNDPHRLPIPPEEVDDIRFLLEEANRELYIYPLPNDKTVVLGLLDNVMSWYKKNISPKLAGDSWSDEGGVYRLVDGFDRLSYVYMLFDRIQQSRDIIKQGSSGLDARFIDGVRERFYEEPLWKDLQGLNEEINFRYTNAYQRSADIAVTPLMFLNPGTILIVAGALVLTGGTGLSFVSFVVRAWQVFGFVAGSGFVAKEVVVKVSENHELIIGGITGLFTDVGESPYDYYSGISVLAELEADAIFVLKNTHDEYALVKVTKTEYNIANVTKEEAEAMIAKAKTLEPVPKEARATEGTRAIENNGTAGKNVPDNPILPEVVKPPKWKKPAKVKEDELTKTKRRIDKLLGKGKLTAKERKISDELLKKLYHDSFLSDQIIKKLVDKGCDKKGLETLRKKLIDKIADASQDVLDVEDLLKIIRKYDFRNIGRSPFCLNFINNFHEANGFENVLIQWMKGKAARKGASFVMKFSNNELKGKKIAFEWPAGYQDSSKFGPESPWRYSDIVVIENGRITKRYELKSWTEKSFEKWGEGLLKQYSKDVILFEKGNFNWVFYANKFFIWRDQSLTREARITLIKKYIIDNLISTISKVDASKIGSAGIKDVTEKELEDAVIIFVEE